MKAFSLAKVITFVSMICIVCGVAWGQGTGQQIVLGNQTFDVKRSCVDAYQKMSSSWSKAIGTCKSSSIGNNFSSCVETLKDCADDDDEEDPILPQQVSALAGLDPSLSSTFGMAGGTSDKCSPYNHTDYKSEERDIKRDLKDTKKSLSDAQKQQVTDKEKYDEQAAKIDEQMQDKQVEKVKQDAQYGQDQRDKAEKREKDAGDLQKAIDDKEMQILQYQNMIKAKIAARQNQVNKYRIDLLKCKIDAEEYAVKAPKKKQAGSVSGLGGNVQDRNNTIKEMFDTCITDVLNRRTAEGEAYKGELDSLNTALSQQQANLMTLKQNQASAATRNAQADQEETAAKQKKDYLDLQAQQNLLKQKFQAAQNFEQKNAYNTKDIQNAGADVNQSSNDLTQFQRYRSKSKGKTSTTDADTATSDYKTAVNNCLSSCAQGLAGDEKELAFLKAQSSKCQENEKSTGGKSTSSSGGTQ